MRERCNSPTCKAWVKYGGRGIQVCERWDSFENFYADMGPSNGLTIERNDVNGHYEPGNCVWASMRSQQNNRRNTRLVTLNGVTKSLSMWCDEFGLSFGMVAQRWRSGWTGADLFLPPGQFRTKATGNLGNRKATGSPPGYRHSEATKERIRAAGLARYSRK